MPLFGSHLSIAGGYYKAVESAHQLGFDTVQIFTKNNNQWRAKPLADDEVERFRSALAALHIVEPTAHNSYLINLASPDDDLWMKSVDAMVVELQRAERLGIRHVVSHPGAHVGTGDEAGLTRIVQGLDIVFERTKGISTTVALEITAGQGSCLGHRFEHLGEIIRRCAHAKRLTCCLDSCHLVAAGYPLSPKKEYEATMNVFDREVGFDRLVAWHLNDSKKPLGSRVDRHEHIGKGCLGLEPFRLIVNDSRFKSLPMYLETAKKIDESTGRPWDEINLEVLRSLLARKGGKR